MRKLSPLILAFTLLISSCCRNENITCEVGILQIHPVGTFLTGSPLIIRYKQDNAFDATIDTFVGSFVGGYTSDTNALTFQSIDSMQTGSYNVTDSFRDGLLPGYDYKILFPADTLTYTITGLNATGSSQMQIKHCGDTSPPRCYDNAYSCTVNGVNTTTLLYSETPAYENYGSYINLVR